MAQEVAWRLPEEIAALSTTPWPQAKHEWALKGITMLDPGEDSQRCLCGHMPIRELCHIENRINHNRAIVGNHCVRLFTAGDTEESVFSSIPRIFDACKRILLDRRRSANEGLIQLAVDRGVFNQWEQNFYLDVLRKRKLSARQENVKVKLNNKLVHLLILSERAAYRLLQAHPEQTTGPRLINLAHDRGQLTDREWRHYRDNWDKIGNGEIDRIERIRMNRKIIDGLRDQMG